MDPRYLPAGMTEKRGSCPTWYILQRGHSRHFLSGIHRLFIWDEHPLATGGDDDKERT